MKRSLTSPVIGILSVLGALTGCGDDGTPSDSVSSGSVNSEVVGASQSSSASDASNDLDSDGNGQSKLADEPGYLPRPVEETIDVSAADHASHRDNARELERLRGRERVTNKYYGTGPARALRTALATAKNDHERMMMGIKLTFAEMDLGNELAALKQMDQSKRLFESALDRFDTETAARVFVFFGMVHLRHGETQNCCLLHNKDSCLLPIRGGGIHTRQDGSRAAIKEFAKAIELAEQSSAWYYEAVWLWNIAAMTLGEHPDGVPEQYRIDPDRFLSEEEFPRLMDVAEELDLATNSLCGSVVADDFNNDGYLDLMVGNWDLRDPLKFYLNDGKGGFVDRTEAAGLNGMPGGLNMVQGDYNNDGRIDVYITRGAWLFEKGKYPDSLLRNNGDGTFTDVAPAAGLTETNHPAQTAAWGDYDLDGWLDLYVGGEANQTNPAPCRLFHNNHDGTFTDIAEPAGVANNRLAKGVAWGDYDNDRYPDLYVSNLDGSNRLYRNQGDGTFTDIARKAGVDDIPVSFPTWFWDFNNDGVLDLFVGAFDADMAQIGRYYLGQRFERGVPHLFRGTPAGRFADVSAKMGLKEPTLPMGCNFGDINGDGYLDMYLGTGSPDYKMIMPNKLYLNQGGRQFSDVSEAAGMSHLQKGHGVAFADLDADGDQDVFIQMGGAFHVDKYVDAVYENPGFGNQWLAVELVGVESNRFGVGSRIRIDVEEDGQSRSIYRWVNSGGSFGCSPMRQHIGVGQATRVQRLEIYWPKSDLTQTFDDVPTGRIIRVTEGADQYVEMNLRSAKFDLSED